MDLMRCAVCGRDVPRGNELVHHSRCSLGAGGGGGGGRGRGPGAGCGFGPEPCADRQPAPAAAEEEHADPVGNPLPVPSAPPLAEEWECPRCTFFNPNNCDLCEACESHISGLSKTDYLEAVGGPNPSKAPATQSISTSSRSSGLPAHDEWCCSSCTLDNPVAVDMCSLCGTVRPARPSYRSTLLPEESECAETPALHRSRPRGAQRSRVAHSALLGAGVGASLALLTNRSITRGAIEGAGMGVLGSVVASALFPNGQSRLRRGQLDTAAPPTAAGAGINFDDLVLHLEQLVQGAPAPRGLPATAVQALPTFHLKDAVSAGGAPCSICLADYCVGDELRTLPCLHMFHSACVDRWLQESCCCPICHLDLARPPPPLT